MKANEYLVVHYSVIVTFLSVIILKYLFENKNRDLLSRST